MSHLTSLTPEELRAYAADLEAFKANIIRHCNTLETGIEGCAAHMKDELSQTAMRKGYQAAEDVKACLADVERLLAMVYNALHITRETDGMSM